MNAYVKATVYRPPTIPSWFSEMLPLSFDLALAIQHFRKLLAEMFKTKKEKEVKEFIEKYAYIDKNSVDAVYKYFWLQNRYAKIPHEARLLIEHYNSEGKHFAIFHSLYGRRVNDALSRALAYLVARLGGRDIEVGINDNGFFLASLQKMQVEKALKMLNADNLKEVLEEALRNSEVFKRRFRHCATRSLMILRSYKGKTKSVGKQQMKSGFLFAAANKISQDFPVIKETRREILEDMMDLGNAMLVLKWIKDGKIGVEEIHNELPSPFSLNLIMQGYADLMKIEDKIVFLKRMYKAIQERVK
jgi:ATP-dependent Lhr-like helicase